METKTMRTQLSAGALLAAALLCSSTANAQNVTLSGVMDLSVRISDHQGADGKSKLQTMSSGGMTPTRLMVNVDEDLGAGLKAVAGLDHRMQADTGAADPGPFWQQSWVGLQSQDFGRITAGRDYNVLFDVAYSTFAPYLPVGSFLYGFKPEIATALGIRNDNQLKYRMMSGPWAAFAQLSADEGASFSTTTGKSAGLGIRYGGEFIQVGLAYLDREDASSRHARAYLAGVAYRKGAVYLNASWARNSFEDGFNTALLLVGSGTENTVLAASPLQSVIHTKRRDLFSIGGMYNLSAQWDVGLQAYFMRQPFYTPGAPTGRAQFQSALAQYSLSKRTALYGALEHTSVDELQLSNSATGLANGATSRMAAVLGIKHTF
jgi:predicted porin